MMWDGEEITWDNQPILWSIAEDISLSITGTFRLSAVYGIGGRHTTTLSPTHRMALQASVSRNDVTYGLTRRASVSYGASRR